MSTTDTFFRLLVVTSVHLLKGGNPYKRNLLGLGVQGSLSDSLSWDPELFPSRASELVSDQLEGRRRSEEDREDH